MCEANFVTKASFSVDVNSNFHAKASYNKISTLGVNFIVETKVSCFKDRSTRLLPNVQTFLPASINFASLQTSHSTRFIIILQILQNTCVGYNRIFKLEQIDFAMICLIIPCSLSICVFAQAREAVQEKTALTKLNVLLFGRESSGYSVTSECFRSTYEISFRIKLFIRT